MHVSEITDAQWVGLRNRLISTLQKKPLHCDSEDLCHHALLKLWQSNTLFQDEAHIFHWCMKTALHHFLNQCRQQKRECVLVGDILDPRTESHVEIFMDLQRIGLSETLQDWSMGYTLQDLSTKCGVSIPAIHKRIKVEVETVRTRLEC